MLALDAARVHPAGGLRRTRRGARAPGATYEITVVRSWSEATNPLDWPGVTAHFTGGIGATHNDAYAMFGAGRIATTGLEMLSQKGMSTPFDQELAAAKSGGNVGAIFQTGAIWPVGGTTTAQVTATDAFPILSFAMMVAPSPDWFTGVPALTLKRNGQWIDVGNRHAVRLGLRHQRREDLQGGKDRRQSLRADHAQRRADVHEGRPAHSGRHRDHSQGQWLIRRRQHAMRRSHAQPLLERLQITQQRGNQFRDGGMNVHRAADRRIGQPGGHHVDDAVDGLVGLDAEQRRAEDLLRLARRPEPA